MTTQLPERLRALADEAPSALSAADLWQTGNRRHRLRVVAALATATCLVLAAALLGNGAWRSRQPSPAAPPATTSGPMSIPQPLFNPSPWIGATRTPGRLVAVLGATRDRFPFGSDRGALVGVTAGSQAYHFLDLPGRSPDAVNGTLSPDGRHYVYWINGMPRRASDLGDRSIVGVAVLDLTSGAVQREELVTEHGLAPVGLTWVDAHTVAIAADSYTSHRVNSFGGRTRVGLLTLGSRDLVRLPRSSVTDVPVTTTGGIYAGLVGHRVLRTYPRNLSGMAVQPGPSRRPSDLQLSGAVRSIAYDAPGGRVAAVAGNPDRSGPTSDQLEVGRVDHGHVHLTLVPGGRRYSDVTAWVDATHVATVRQTRNGLIYDVVDVRTGARRELTRKPWYGFDIAGDALRHATTVPGIEPHRPWNPRWVAGGILGGMLLLGGGTLLVSRRSRRVRR
jgi:hypothetical protein